MDDILIRGMEEPPHCSACRMLEGDTDDGFCHAANKWFDDEWFCWYQYPDGDIATDRPLNCPLVSIPEGHGRLKDSTEIIGKIKEKYCGACLCPTTSLNCQLCKITKVIEIIENAPTIVPAEGGTDDVRCL